jgi:signal transduction histidine kinase
MSTDLDARAAQLRPWHLAAWTEGSDPAFVFRVDDLVVVDANAAADMLFAPSPGARAELSAELSIVDIFEPEALARVRAALRRKEGPRRLLSGLAVKPRDAGAVFDAGLVFFEGSPAVCLCRLSELRRPTTDSELRRLNWALAAYARSSTALMHFTDIEQLVTNVCQAIVGDDQYPVAAVALAEDAPGRPVRIVAGAGRAAGYLDGLPLSWSDEAPEGRGPVGTAIRSAIRSGEPFLMRDSFSEPVFEAWRDRARRHGIRSSVTVPFCKGDRPVGVVMVYAERADAFGPQELDVFVKLGRELAFAMTVQEARDQLKASEEARSIAEQAARDSQAELMRAARLLSVGVFASSIAHEINQPVAAIMTNGDAALRWLDKQPPDTAEARAALERIILNANRASEVVRRTRGLLTKARYVRKPLDINQLLRDTLVLTENDQQRAGVRVETRLTPLLPPVLGDPGQLQQVTVNLIVNAIDAMRSVGDRPRLLTLSSRADAGLGRVWVEIADTGPGVAIPDQDRIFENFFTTKPEGIGLGLPISRSIIESHAGSMSVRASQPFGTVFEFSLPIAKA